MTMLVAILFMGPAKASRKDQRSKISAQRGRRPITNAFTGGGASTTGFKYSVLTLVT
jgi:hypothetical protein